MEDDKTQQKWDKYIKGQIQEAPTWTETPRETLPVDLRNVNPGEPSGGHSHGRGVPKESQQTKVSDPTKEIPPKDRT